MKFEYFEIKNFKGIENLKITLNKSPNFNVHALIGLNESGKTTILEAINYFKHKTETLESLELKGYKIEDIHDIIPISKRDNFNGSVSIKGGLILDEGDEKAIADFFKTIGITLTKKIEKLAFTQEYFFKDSKHLPLKNSATWSQNFYGKKTTGTVVRKLEHTISNKALPLIWSLIPNILYFPNFLFDFPSKIYLQESVGDEKHKFYKSVMQDILDSLNNDLDIDTHLIKRALSADKNDRKHLESVLDKMGSKITREIFDAWTKILNKEIFKKEIIINQDTDDKGLYLEVLLKDSDGKYSINERSLGFRWFFVFLLLTQFRAYRIAKSKNSLFLLDEPASNLHSSAQVQLLQSFEKLNEVIYTTHSHHLINPLWLENTYIVKNEGLDYINDTENFSSSKTKITATPYRQFASHHPDQTSYYQPILNVLDYAPSNFEFIESSVFVEGKNDYYSFNYFQNRIVHSASRSKINFLPGTSAGNLDTLISLYLGWGKTFLILLDSDSEGKKQKKRYIELFGVAIETLIYTYEDIDVKWSNQAIERLYKDEDFESILTLFYSEPNKKNKLNFHRSVQELLINKQIVNFDNETKTNFTKVFDFLSEKLKNIVIE